jgi:hypothetical protein
MCTSVGLLAGWLPWLVHGPALEKFDLVRLDGRFAVAAYFVARLSIGIWVGLTSWPERWWLRGALCGVLAMLPPACISLATPGCGPRCGLANVASAAAVGVLVAGVAMGLTGRERA